MDVARARELLETSHRVLLGRVRDLSPGPTRERLALVLELGRVQRALGSDETEDTLAEAIALAAGLHESGAERTAQVELGAWLTSRREAEAARPHLERALESARHASDPRAAHDLATAGAELALVHAFLGDGAAVEPLLAIARAAVGAAPGARARLELRTGDLHQVRGERTAAVGAYTRALEAAASGTDPLERAAVELAASDALERVPPARVTARELAALDPATLGTLLEAAFVLPRTPAEARATRAAQLALHLTGALGAQVCQGPRVLASEGVARSPDLEARHADLVLRLVSAPGSLLGERERLVARAILAALEERSDAAGEAAPSRVLAMLDRVLGAGLELERLVAVATDLAVEATGAARGLLLIREPGAHLGYRAARGAGKDLVDPPRIASRSLVREVFLSGRPILLEDAASDARLGTATSVGGRGLRSVLVAPIPDQDGSALGVLYLDDPGTIGRFGSAERDVAIGFARRLGAPLRAVLESEQVRATAALQARAAAGSPARPRTRHDFPEIVGHGRAVGALLQLLDRAVLSHAPVLVSGESGTGKELVARALHRSSARSQGPFVAVSCSTLAEGVLESELFGHVAGAFTGAVATNPGLFTRAHGGVLFLDEVQDASPRLQAELLRVLETGEVRPVGGTEVRRVDVRTVVATNVDLAALVTAGSFREDLYYRLNVIHVRIPPLRERLEDVPELALHLLERAGAAGRRLEPGALERLLADPWTGNVRALRNALERALVLAGPGPIRAEHVVLEPARRAPPPSAAPSPVYVGAVELNERQLSVIDRLRSEGEVGNAEHSGREGVTQQTGWRDLTELVAKGVLVRSGRGKKTVYRLAPGWEARIAGG